MLDRLKTFCGAVLFPLWAVPVAVAFALCTFYWMAAARFRGEFFDEEEGEDFDAPMEKKTNV